MATETEYKQYINLDPDEPDQLDELPKRRAGRQVKVCADVSPAKQGVLVLFELKPGFNNVRAYCSQRRITVTDKDGRAVASFYLLGSGGDEWNVSVFRLTKDGQKESNLASSKYVLWRRIYYQGSSFLGGPRGHGRLGPYFAPIPWFDMDPVKKEFTDRNHNIELVPDTSQPQIRRYFNVLNEEKQHAESATHGYNKNREPVTLRMVLVNQIARKKTHSEKFIQTREGRPFRIPLAKTIWKDESLPPNDDWLISADWRWRFGDFSWKSIDRDHITAIGANQIEVDIPGIPQRDVDIAPFLPALQQAINHDIEIRIAYNFKSSSAGGRSWYNVIWIAHTTMYGGKIDDVDRQDVTIHEIGHFIGMVPSVQKSHYTEHDHIGPHCSTGLSESDLSKQSYEGLGGTCVMFGELNKVNNQVPPVVRTNGQFCTECDTSVRKSAVRITNTMPSSWFPTRSS